MPYDSANMDKHHRLSEFCRLIAEESDRRTGTADSDTSSSSPKCHVVVDQEKRVRREIANSNERRRMQSINAGFQALRSLLPQHEGDKLSKAAILQQTTDYVHNLERDRSQLMNENTKLRQLLTELGHPYESSSPPPKRKKTETVSFSESSDEGISMNYEDQTIEQLRWELAESRCQFERERRIRTIFEERVHAMETQQQQQQHQHLRENIMTTLNIKREQQIAMPENGQHLEIEPVPQPTAAAEAAAAAVGVEVIKTEVNPVIIPNHVVTDHAMETSMSRRNLETIVEAIRHLEGESALEKPSTTTTNNRAVDDSEDTNTASSDPDEDQSEESSGRDSPMFFRPKTVQTVLTNSERYPVALRLLHRPTISHEQFIHHHRPNTVIIHNTASS
ncbi:transcription factor AP-4-like [Tubulanus polymorphus]|uniref:transcription factor AP-4-like n=1 Tax=Tubulanus polymorphus TaxID=672921 RepID=UPI003DA44C78